jgi:hypothetical protein
MEKDNMDSFECKICHELMYDARTIKCGHTFCHDCLSSFKEKICPICHKTYNLIPKTNETIKDFLKKRKRDKSANCINEIQKYSKTESNMNVISKHQVKPSGAKLYSNSNIKNKKDTDEGEKKIESNSVAMSAMSAKSQFLKDINNKEVRESDLKNNNLIESLNINELLLMNNEDLKTILKERGETLSGNKEDLIEKITNYQITIKKSNKELKKLIKTRDIENVTNDDLELILRQRCLKIQGNKSEKISTLINYFRNQIE